MKTSLLPTLTLISTLSLLAACDKDVEETGDTSAPETSSKKTSLSGMVQGDASSATEVRTFLVDSDGSMTEDSWADVNLDGSFTVEVSAESDTDQALVQAIDGNGEILGSVLVESYDRSEDATTVVTPIDTESMVETELWLELVARSGDSTQVLYSDIRGRVDADVAAALDSADDGSTEMEEYATALHAALLAESEAMAERGHDASLSMMQQTELDASLELTGKLHEIASSEMDPAERLAATLEAEEAFESQITAAYESAWSGMSEADKNEDSAEIQAISSLALLTMLSASNDGGAEDIEAWDASALVYGDLQAWLASRSMESRAMTEDWDASAEAALTATLEDLQTDTEDAYASGDLDAMAEAWTSLEGEVLSEDADDGLMGALFELSLSETLAYESHAQAVLSASAMMYSEFYSAAVSAQEMESTAAAEAMASASVDAWSDYEDSVSESSLDLTQALSVSSELNDAESLFATLSIQSSGNFVLMQ